MYDKVIQGIYSLTIIVKLSGQMWFDQSNVVWLSGQISLVGQMLILKISDD